MPVEPLSWYALTFGTYLVIEISDTAEEDVVINGGLGYVKCTVKTWYSDSEEMGNIEERYIQKDDVNRFRQGDMLFVELEQLFWIDEKAYFKISESERELCCTPIVDGRLKFTKEFCKTRVYSLLEEYNDAVRGYASAVEEGKKYYMEFDSNLFYDGMLVEEASLKYYNNNDKQVLAKQVDVKSNENEYLNVNAEELLELC